MQLGRHQFVSAANYILIGMAASSIAFCASDLPAVSHPDTAARNAAILKQYITRPNPGTYSDMEVSEERGSDGSLLFKQVYFTSQDRDLYIALVLYDGNQFFGSYGTASGNYDTPNDIPMSQHHRWNDDGFQGSAWDYSIDGTQITDKVEAKKLYERDLEFIINNLPRIETIK
ncbi:MAG: hypothetical protein AABX32_00735 [Nanoarchaeota archaeon]|mgnify:CR=1 FL=1